MSIQDSDSEVIHTALQWLRAGHRVDLVTVVRTWGSSPRPVGSLAVVRDDGTLVGSVSGGCVEKQLAESVARDDGQTIVTHHIDDEQARRFGLSCGGQLELVFESLSRPSELEAVEEALQKRQRICRTLEIATSTTRITSATDDDAFEFDGQLVKKVFGPQWRILLIGAGQLSSFTAQFALPLEFEVLVSEPRPEFQRAWQVPGCQLLPDSPDDAVVSHASDARSAVLALTHDPNLDDMALMEALPSKAFYVGALGSKKNYENRRKRLAAIGLEEKDINRLVGPIGIDIGSKTSAEIAISIVADLIRCRAAAA